MSHSPCDGIILAKAALDRLLSAREEEWRLLGEASPGEASPGEANLGADPLGLRLERILATCQWMVLPPKGKSRGSGPGGLGH